MASTGLRLVDASGESEIRPLLCGAMHYFQHTREQWDPCLDRFAELGLRIVDTHVPWVVHEREAGSYVFDCDRFAQDSLGSGSGGRCRNLVAFLEACKARGLGVLLRPGPQVGAELTGFGFPWRILADQQCQAVGGGGNPVILPAPPRFFPVPSYASRRLLAEACAWLEAVARAVRPHLWPDGPVLAMQVDNELTPFYRDGAYDQDYHPDAIELFRRYLEQRYGSGPGALGGGLPPGYGCGSVDEVEPPRRMDARTPEALVPHLDWVAFKEWMILRALSRFAEALRGAGVDRVPLLHNVLSTPGGGPASLAAVEQQLDIAGLDLHPLARDYAATRRAAQHAAGSSRLPLLTELCWGGWPWWFPQTLHDQLTTALTALMHGVRGFTIYMTVERDRWIGGAVAADGRPRGDRFETTKQLVSAVVDSGLPALRRDVAVGLMRVEAYRHLARCTSLVDPLPLIPLSFLQVGPCEYSSHETFGFDGPVQRASEQFGRAAEEALDELRLAFRLVDSAADAQHLARYRLLVVPAFDFMPRALIGRLQRFVDQGGTLVLGPRRPALDETMRPLGVELPPHTLVGAEELSSVVGDLADRLGIGPVLGCDCETVELALYRQPRPAGEERGDGAAAVIFAANRADSSCSVAIHGVDSEGKWVWDAISGDPVDPRCLQLEAHQVRMLRLRPSRPAGEAR